MDSKYRHCVQLHCDKLGPLNGKAGRSALPHLAYATCAAALTQVPAHNQADEPVFKITSNVPAGSPRSRGFVGNEALSLLIILCYSYASCCQVTCLGGDFLDACLNLQLFLYIYFLSPY